MGNRVRTPVSPAGRGLLPWCGGPGAAAPRSTSRCALRHSPWGGRAAFIASGAKAPESPRSDVASLRPAVNRDRPHLERVLALVAAGAVRMPEITVYPLSEAVKAHEVSQGRHLKGKLVFKVR